MDVLGISLKVGQRGTSKTYVVKNIYKFLQVYQEKRAIWRTNKQSFF
ncbi:Superfamily II DNA/RNA helicase, SNF2 family [Enterococcus sp. HSIEG1]|nr:Superfamily II DNA/RNA helicase, SNF2 family [Enterococcus sp. HSIEG1]